MDRDNQRCPVLVLLSGGVDSSSLVHYHLSRGDKVNAIFFDYGQPSCKREFQSAKAVSEYYGIKLRRVNFGFTIHSQEGEFYCRNALFILAACSFIKNSASFISIGIHSGTPFYDTTPAFINDIQLMLDGYFGGIIRIIAPFLNFSKDQVYEYAIQEKVPIHLTYSCEIGQKEPCGACPSCIDRRMLDGISSRKDKDC